MFKAFSKTKNYWKLFNSNVNYKYSFFKSKPKEEENNNNNNTSQDPSNFKTFFIMIKNDP
jgi:hypothetical protein